MDCSSTGAEQKVALFPNNEKTPNKQPKTNLPSTKPNKEGGGMDSQENSSNGRKLKGIKKNVRLCLLSLHSGIQHLFLLS